MVQKQTEGGKEDTHDGRGRRSLGERIREKLHKTFYSDGKEAKRELDRLIEEEKSKKQ